MSIRKLYFLKVNAPDRFRRYIRQAETMLVIAVKFDVEASRDYGF